MGQEIAYCALCGSQLRSVDFEKGGAFRVDIQSYCKKCAPEAVKSLPPEKIQAILKQGQIPKNPPTARAVKPAASTPSRVLPAKRGSSTSWAVGLAAAVVAGVAILLAVVVGGRGTPTEPPRPGPVEVPRVPSATKPPEPERRPEAPAPPAKSREELRAEEAQRKLDEIKAVEKDVAADVIRRRYAAFARDYADTPQGRTIESWLKTSEPAVAEAKADPPKPPEPAPPVPPEPKPVEPPAPAPPAPAVPKRSAVPDVAKLREAEAAYQKAFRPEQAKLPADKAKLARTLLTVSGAKDAELYVLLREARDLAAQGLDVKTALDAIAARAAAFDVDRAEDKVDLFAKTTVKGAPAGTWSAAALDVAEELADADEYEGAVKLAGRAEALARAAGDKGLETTAKDRGKDLADLKRAADGLRAHFKTLESKPDDPAANAAVGKFVCLVKGDWKRGLALLAKGSDVGLKTLAEQELANPAEPAAQAALGEAWAARAEKETTTYKPRARVRAVEWLSRAIPGLSGLAKVTAEKSLAALGSIAGSKNPLVLDVGGGVKLDLLYVRAGTFTMGGTQVPTSPWLADERPEHKVTLSKGYLMGKHEVTRGQFAAFVKATGYKTEAEREGTTWGRGADGGYSHIPGLNWQSTNFPQTDEHPVVCVSWNDAKAFCDWAARKTGRGVRLPTEAEWEHACRAGTKTAWSFGDDESLAGDFAWTSRNSEYRTHPVGQKRPNPWGFFDLHGNAWEWCLDWAGPYSGDAVDPAGPSSGQNRPLRGGRWDDPPSVARSALRGQDLPERRHSYSGFRVALP